MVCESWKRYFRLSLEYDFWSRKTSVGDDTCPLVAILYVFEIVYKEAVFILVDRRHDAFETFLGNNNVIDKFDAEKLPGGDELFCDFNIRSARL